MEDLETHKSQKNTSNSGLETRGTGCYRGAGARAARVAGTGRIGRCGSGVLSREPVRSSDLEITRCDKLLKGKQETGGDIRVGLVLETGGQVKFRRGVGQKQEDVSVGAVANRRLGASIRGYIFGRGTALVPRRNGSHPVEERRVGSISVTHRSIEI